MGSDEAGAAEAVLEQRLGHDHGVLTAQDRERAERALKVLAARRNLASDKPLVRPTAH
ncbi:hypothetical protein [Streptomyces erythrochromogenes]|uniref:hypothetical protein n=1 Tax=Streptomyces erythrochromogenes TaxID=285574 RepID=UPI00131A9718|nr:hypothetical protein [Streptomyces erythrochromogenes]